jgi:hypothetical protein
MKTVNTLLASLARVQASIPRLQAERTAWQAQPLGRADSAAAFGGAVEAMAAQWSDRVELAIGRIAGGWSPTTALELMLAPGGQRAPDCVALVGLTGADTLKAAAHARLDTVADGPSAAERKARLAAIEADLEDLEFREERLIEALEAEGMPVARRPDCRIEIVLAAVEPADAVEPEAAAPLPPHLEAEVLRDAAIRKARASQPAPAKSPYLARGDV